jgi:hypothetical protein
VAWQSTTSTSSCESGSEGRASTIWHDRSDYANAAAYHIRFLFVPAQNANLKL